MDETIATLRKIVSFPSFVTDYAADIPNKQTFSFQQKRVSVVLHMKFC